MTEQNAAAETGALSRVITVPTHDPRVKAHQRAAHSVTIVSGVDMPDLVTAPPERVLVVSVIDEVAFLDICSYTDTHDSTTTARLESATVSVFALVRALEACVPGWALVAAPVQDSAP